MLSALQRWAEDEFRSVNGQIEYLLHDALRKAGRLPAKQSDDTNAANPADEQAE